MDPKIHFYDVLDMSHLVPVPLNVRHVPLSLLYYCLFCDLQAVYYHSDSTLQLAVVRVYTLMTSVDSSFEVSMYSLQERHNTVTLHMACEVQSGKTQYSNTAYGMPGPIRKDTIQ